MERDNELLPALVKSFLPAVGKILGNNVSGISGEEVKINRRGLREMLGRFICIGCGERSSAENADLCRHHNSLIHTWCQKKICVVSYGRTIFEPDVVALGCPICSTEVGRKEVY